jgi:hypothetical protein
MIIRVYGLVTSSRLTTPARLLNAVSDTGAGFLTPLMSSALNLQYFSGLPSAQLPFFGFPSNFICNDILSSRHLNVGSKSTRHMY